MPMYLYECQDCDEQFEEMALIAKREDPQACPECGEVNSRKILTAANLNFPGDGWASKNGRIENQMREKNKRLRKKEDEQKRSGLVPSLVPNVGGEQVKDWSDAAKLAKDKGKVTTGYEKYARKEKAKATA